jgi:hypothetical protein
MKVAVVLVLLLLGVWPARAEVLKAQEVVLKRVVVSLAPGARAPEGFKEPQLVFTDVGRGRLRDLQGLDLVVDSRGRLTALVLRYSLQGLKRVLLVRDFSALLLERPRRPLKRRPVLLRVITSQEVF